MENIYEYIKREKGEEEFVQLEISIVKVDRSKSRYTGNEARYMRAYIDGKEVTRMVAEATNLNVSRANATNGCLIIHGCGMDMAFALQDRMYKHAYAAGYPKMFSSNWYKTYQEGGK